jgi:hypothetical protein
MSLTVLPHRRLGSAPHFGGAQSPLNRAIQGLPSCIREQFDDKNIPRTIKYVTWVAPALLYPPLTYFSTTEKKTDGKENLVRQYALNIGGPIVMLGSEAIFSKLFKSKFSAWFKNQAQIQLSSFFVAYAFCTLWGTFCAQRMVELTKPGAFAKKA